MATKTKSKSALTRVGPGAAHLSPGERELLAEALRLGEEARDKVQEAIVGFGRWLLVNVFGDDARAALDDRSDNPVWLELRRRAGGPTLAMSDRMLYVALQLAARDKRIGDQAWRSLDAGRKEILLPLADDAKIREAAQHVAKFNLTQAKTRVYVRSLLEQAGSPPALRLTGPRLVARLRALRGGLEGRRVLKKLGELGAKMDVAARREALSEIKRLMAALEKAEETLSGRA